LLNIQKKEMTEISKYLAADLFHELACYFVQLKGFEYIYPEGIIRKDTLVTCAFYKSVGLNTVYLALVWRKNWERNGFTFSIRTEKNGKVVSSTHFKAESKESLRTIVKSYEVPYRTAV
jgi:hypothetical protein